MKIVCTELSSGSSSAVAFVKLPSNALNVPMNFGGFRMRTGSRPAGSGAFDRLGSRRLTAWMFSCVQCRSYASPSNVWISHSSWSIDS